jgi:hypothetical protein
MSETYETIQRRPEYIEQREQALLDKIFGTESGGVFTGGLVDAEAYPDLFKIPEYKIAPETDLEQSIYNTFDTDAERQAFMDRYQPYFTDATGAAKYFPTASKTMDTGIGKIEGALGTEDDDYFPQASTYIESGTEAFDPSTGVADYMNPYKQSVIDEAMKQIDKQGAQAMQKMNAQAVGAGAFGGSRAGVQAAATQGNIQDARAKTIANMMAQGYDKSLGAAMSGFEAEQKRNLEGGRLTGGLGQTVGGLGSKLVDAGSSYGTLGGTSADVGRVYSAMTPADMGFMYGLGQTQRDYDQRVLDNKRREGMRGTEQALYPINYAYGALSGTPSAGVTNQFGVAPAQPGTNPFIAGIGAYTALSGINQQRT